MCTMMDRTVGRTISRFTRLGGVMVSIAVTSTCSTVIFKIQSYDWASDNWIAEDVLVEELKFLLSSGVKHVAYYPDNVYENKPDLERFVSIISAREFPKAWEDESMLKKDN